MKKAIKIAATGLVVSLFLFGGASCAKHHMKTRNVCNPCSKTMSNPCNPCAKKMKNSCNPCAKKAMNPCNPCGK